MRRLCEGESLFSYREGILMEFYLYASNILFVCLIKVLFYYTSSFYRFDKFTKQKLRSKLINLSCRYTLFGSSAYQQDKIEKYVGI